MSDWNDTEESELWEETSARATTHQAATGYTVAARLLSHKEEVELALKAQAGCEASRNLMLEANIRLVVSVARRYTCRSLTLEDLVQEGIIGLVEAIQKFDTTLGFKFSTYATYWIRQSVVRAIEKQDRMIRLPAYGCNAERKVCYSRRSLALSLGRDPTIEEIADDTGLSRRLIEALQQLGPEPVSLNTMFGEDADIEFQDLMVDHDAVEPEDASMQQFDREQVMATLDQLRERERMVIMKRFAIGYDRIYSLREIAEELGMSREGVRHMQNRTLKRLKRMLRLESGFTQGDD